MKEFRLSIIAHHYHDGVVTSSDFMRDEIQSFQQSVQMLQVLDQDGVEGYDIIL